MPTRLRGFSTQEPIITSVETETCMANTSPYITMNLQLPLTLTTNLNYTLTTKETGLVHLKLEGEIVRFGEVMYFRYLRRNLISGCRLEGNEVQRGNGRMKEYTDGETMFMATIKNALYYIYTEPLIKHKKVNFKAFTVQKDELKIRHRRMGHISPNLTEDTYK